MEQHQALQQREGQLTDDVTSLVQNTGALDVSDYNVLEMFAFFFEPLNNKPFRATPRMSESLLSAFLINAMKM